MGLGEYDGCMNSLEKQCAEVDDFPFSVRMSVNSVWCIMLLCVILYDPEGMRANILLNTARVQRGVNKYFNNSFE